MDFVTIRSFFSPGEAYVVAGQLQAAGLDAFVRDENAASAVTGYSSSIGGIRVQVPADQVAEAELLLQSNPEDPAATPDAPKP